MRLVVSIVVVMIILRTVCVFYPSYVIVITLNHLLKMASDPDIFGKMARSIAPEIYGHEVMRIVLLLQIN